MLLRALSLPRQKLAVKLPSLQPHLDRPQLVRIYDQHRQHARQKARQPKDPEALAPRPVRRPRGMGVYEPAVDAGYAREDTAVPLGAGVFRGPLEHVAR
ncbi:hypothetical protein MAJ_03034, partial [Metarhizium majus ARSEF 297]